MNGEHVSASRPARCGVDAHLPFKGRHFLFLQGPASPFFAKLAEALKCAGARVTRIYLCGGDQVFWGHDAQAYTGSFKAWPAYFATICEQLSATDLVLFGDCRPYHAPAVAHGKTINLRLHLFEEGYVRPGYITHESRGVNAHSDLPRDPAQLLKEAELSAEAAPRPGVFAEDFATRARGDVMWHAGLIALAPRYWRYRRHTVVLPVFDYAGWIWHAMRGARMARADRAALRMIEDGTPFFLFPLQLDGDFQMRVHSDFTSGLEVAETVIRSFAAYAPEGHRLVIKRHPFDVDFQSKAGAIRALAGRFGVSERIVFVSKGPIEPLVEVSAGVVLVNSTTAISALKSGRPLKVLGRATYNIEGLSYQGGLDSFWQAAPAPKPALVDAYIQTVIAWTQLPGSFFAPEGIQIAVAACLDRMRDQRGITT